jgi:hypothetical protein
VQNLHAKKRSASQLRELIFNGQFRRIPIAIIFSCSILIHHKTIDKNGLIIEIDKQNVDGWRWKD